MDRQMLALFIPIIALSIPVVAVVMHGLQKIWALRVEEARARQGIGGEGSGRMEALEAEVAHMRAELGDVQERLDFAERALAQTRGRARLQGE